LASFGLHIEVLLGRGVLNALVSLGHEEGGEAFCAFSGIDASFAIFRAFGTLVGSIGVISDGGGALSTFSIIHGGAAGETCAFKEYVMICAAGDTLSFF
jgi:hypothetical protein